MAETDPMTRRAFSNFIQFKSLSLHKIGNSGFPSLIIEYGSFPSSMTSSSKDDGKTADLYSSTTLIVTVRDFMFFNNLLKSSFLNR